MYEDIKTLLYETIHRNKKSVAQIADETGISANYLYRSGLPVGSDQSGVRFPVEYLVTLMKATNNFKLLEYLAKLCGFLLVRVPRVKCCGKKDQIDLLDEYQEVNTKAVRALKEFFNSPDKTHYFLVEDALREVMEHSASASKFCKKTVDGQIEMDLE